MDNQQREQESLNPETQEIAQLEELLAEAIAAEEFFERASGKLWLKLAQAEINRVLKDITSDKYEKDHMGYLKALADLQAYKKMIRKMQVGASSQRKAKIQERLDSGE